jgi:transposase
VIGIGTGARILIATKPVDFRKGAEGLACLAREVLGQDPFAGTVIVFRSRRADRVKLIAWDGTGLVRWPRFRGQFCGRLKLGSSLHYAAMLMPS